MSYLLKPRQLLVVIVVGWMDRQQQRFADYLGNGLLSESRGARA